MCKPYEPDLMQGCSYRWKIGGRSQLGFDHNQERGDERGRRKLVKVYFEIM